CGASRGTREQGGRSRLTSTSAIPSHARTRRTERFSACRGIAYTGLNSPFICGITARWWSFPPPRQA
ncbi:MAG: hypothetical protein AVDCRST_MAG93-5094, partial [uncultured Chloroflexia bacterium]